MAPRYLTPENINPPIYLGEGEETMKDQLQTKLWLIWHINILTSNLKVGLGRKEEGRKERIERKKKGKNKTKRSTKKQKTLQSHIVIRGLEHRYQ